MPRPINVSGTGLEIVLALSQRPGGARVTDLAHALGTAVTTADSALTRLAQLGIVERMRAVKRSRLRAERAEVAELLAIAERTPDAERATEIVLRANEAVAFACRDDEGYLISVEPSLGPSVAILDGALERIRAGRSARGGITRFEAAEFGRLLRMVPSLRVRIAAAAAVKGGSGAGSRSPSA